MRPQGVHEGEKIHGEHAARYLRDSRNLLALNIEDHHEASTIFSRFSSRSGEVRQTNKWRRLEVEGPARALWRHTKMVALTSAGQLNC